MKSSINQTRVSDTTLIEVVHLHPAELDLIKAIRNQWRFGDVTIRVRDGLPFRLLRVHEFIDLAGKPLDSK